METIGRRGLMLVLSSPSGAGKTTIARRVLDEDEGVAASISHTTREQRPGEVDGQDYHFVDKRAFSRMREQGDFLEWAVVFDNYYGTTRDPVEQALGSGVSVFVLPPTADALEQRLKTRAQDSAAVVVRRMRGASNEIQHWKDYDYVLVNFDVDQSVAAVHAILAAERLRRTRLTGLNEFVEGLLSQL
jgi:guanylate kinase